MKRLTDEQRALVERNLGLAHALASRFIRRFPMCSRCDMKQAAYIGLAKAALNYDPTRNRFSSYACPRIRGALRDEVRRQAMHGLAGLKGLASLREVLARLTSAPVSLDCESLVSRYDYESWHCADDEPVRRGDSVPRLRRPAPGDAAPGTRLVKGGGYQARPWVRDLGRNVNLGLFTVAHFSTQDAARTAAGMAALAFRVYYRPGQPGRGLGDTIAHLKACGFTPRKARSRDAA